MTVAELKLDIHQQRVATLESFRSLRTNLIYSENVNVIAITSSTPNEGKTVNAYYLAIAFAEMGKKVLIIDCDLRKGSMRRYFTFDRSTDGLSELLSGQTKKVIIHTSMENLDYIPSGKIPPNPSELLSNERLQHYLDKLKEQYDYIIIDTPPMEAALDAAIVGRYCDGVVLVIRNDTVSRRLIKKNMTQLERNGCRIVGAALNGVKKGHSEYKYSYYYNYYGYGTKKE